MASAKVEAQPHASEENAERLRRLARSSGMQIPAIIPRSKNMKRTSVAIASILAASTAAFAQAQTTSPPPPATQPPAATTPTTPPAATTGVDNQSTYYTRQQGEFRASDLIGATVRNAANENIGDISELVLSPDGRIMAAIIGVGGFLGIGQRDVALDFKSLRIERDSSAMTQRGSFIVRVNATKDSLQNAPEWKDPTTPAGK